MAATPEQITAAITELTSKLELQTQTLNTVQAQNVQLANRLQTREQEVEELKGAIRRQGPQASQSQGGAGDGRDSIVQKWAPEPFTGERAAWQDWALKFKSYTGAMKAGEVGRWIQQVEDNRDVRAVVATCGEASRATAALLHSALIATCQGVALTIVKRAGSSEGLEAWRQLLHNYEPHSRQTTVMKLIELLSFDFASGRLQDRLEDFDMKVNEYEKESKEAISDNMRIGVVIKGMEKGSLREHLLLHSERCTTYAA